MHYKNSDLKSNYIRISDHFAKIQSVKVSPSGKFFLVETDDKIQHINTMTEPHKIETIFNKSSNLSYVDMFIIEPAQIDT